MRLLPGIAFLILLAAAVNAVSIDSGVLTELQDSNEVSVIVMLEEDASLADVLIEKEHEFGEMNGFSGTVSRESLGNLLNNVDVAGIQLNKPVSILMTQGAPLINATQAWALTLNGTNITGRGETVCVIDTGIDYNHTSLGGSWGSRVLSGYNYCANDACSQESGDPYDNHGHGTHVAGIIASNDSTNRGIAPDANLIAIKALNSAGSGTDDDVIAGINWCIANATAYNISVISMSIGSGSSTGYCDSSESAYSTAINSAVAKNISVVIASGNDASNTSISVPGCIENATTVGAVYDADIGAYGSDSTTFADKITYYTNRNSRLDFLAPGSRITSTLATVEGGGFGNKHGTSMATPMVSGAFALLHQYKKLDNGTILNPSQIENTFRLTGVNVSDSRTGLNFTRISAYAAIRSIDTFRPLLTMLSPLNATYNTTNISLSYSASDNIAIDACTFTNTTGSTETLFGCSNTTFLAAENQQNNITLSINDSNGNTNSSQIFFFVDTALPLLSVFQPQ
ncbi:MAG: S8 family serine peptidase, partial [Candidatus Aenigmarchaeota archaeon]|nr:S8 family serine peptidase [Candidatus Aenigmarchaeota archaeon]